MSALLPFLDLERDDFASLAKKLPQPHVKLSRIAGAHVPVGDVVTALSAHENCAVVPPQFHQLGEERSAPRTLTGVVNDTAVLHNFPRSFVRMVNTEVPFGQVLDGEHCADCACKFAQAVAA